MINCTYCSTSTGWLRRGSKRVPHRDLNYRVQRAFLPTLVGTILHEPRLSNKIHVEDGVTARVITAHLLYFITNDNIALPVAAQFSI